MAYFKGYGWLLTGLMAFGTTACFDSDKEEEEEEEEEGTDSLDSLDSSDGSSDSSDGSSDGSDGTSGGDVTGSWDQSLSTSSAYDGDICAASNALSGSVSDWCDGLCDISFVLDISGDGGCEPDIATVDIAGLPLGWGTFETTDGGSIDAIVYTPDYYSIYLLAYFYGASGGTGTGGFQTYSETSAAYYSGQWTINY